ncbi:MAG: cell wall-active antibiotics response protein [Bacteroidetes bacterium]|nr:cell wall-active antibiotics response protein [Bacteroidota bacterium]
MNREERHPERFRSSRSGRFFGGTILIVVGGILLARQMGVAIPEWALTWQMLLIAIGVFVGARRSFQPGGWMVLIVVGGAFLLNDFYPKLSFSQYIWPLAIILFGVIMIFKPGRRKRYWDGFQNESSSSENNIDINSVFGGTKKRVVSKDFKGGEVNAVFGGNDLDFSQADINGTATLELNVVFGGAKLIVPAHWKIESNVDCVFGSVEDKRKETNEVAENKTLILKGGVVFGSIEIKSY